MSTWQSSSTRRSARLVGAAVAATVLGVGLAAAPAQAAGNAHYYAYVGGGSMGSGPQGSVEFASNGEVWTIRDLKADGYGVELQWYLTGNGYQDWTDYRTNTSGAGTSFVYNASYIEGTGVHFRVCLEKGGVEKQCSGYANGTA